MNTQLDLFRATFLLKKIVSGLLLDPLFFSLILIFAGLIFLSYTRKQRFGRVLVGFGAFILLSFSLIDVSTFLTGFLESVYPVYQKTDKKIDYVVVLSGGAEEKYGIPMNTQGSNITLSRLIEGIRVYKLNQGSRIILTGGIPHDNPSSEIEKRLLIDLGIPSSYIITDHKSMDTSDEAVFVRKIVADAPFALVTSSTHMPRAMKLFRKQGLNPIPAPTGFLCSDEQMPIVNKFSSAGSLIDSDRAIHEYIGILWSKLRGQIE